MKPILFVTGATGFVGRALLPGLRKTDRWQLRLLVRDSRALRDLADSDEIVTGDLGDPESYRAALHGADTILHLAAMTGKASKAVHDNANRQVTVDLIANSKAAGVKKFLFVSSIAAGYSDKAFYPYASAKLAAETALSNSGLRYTILRPTLIFGPGSPLWDALGTLAKLPVLPLPGNRAPAIVQPIALEDVCNGIVEVLERNAFANESLDLGGPDQLALENLLLKIAQARFGKRPRVLKLPLRFVQWPLALLEPVARAVMPATAGQFAVFGNDSTCRANWLTDALAPGMTSTERMIKDLVGHDTGDGDATAISQGPVTSETDATIEAQRLGLHMTGQAPSSASVAHYVRGLSHLALDREPTAFDQAALRRVRAGGLGFWLMDAYSGLADRRGLLRRRQLLLAAILENDGATHGAFDNTSDSGATLAILRLFGTGLSAGLLTVAALALFVPFRLWLGRTGRAQG